MTVYNSSRATGDVASTNATSARFLGGRQKAWMDGAPMATNVRVPLKPCSDASDLSNACTASCRSAALRRPLSSSSHDHVNPTWNLASNGGNELEQTSPPLPSPAPSEEQNPLCAANTGIEPQVDGSGSAPEQRRKRSTDARATHPDKRTKAAGMALSLNTQAPQQQAGYLPSPQNAPFLGSPQPQTAQPDSAERVSVANWAGQPPDPVTLFRPAPQVQLQQLARAPNAPLPANEPTTPTVPALAPSRQPVMPQSQGCVWNQATCLNALNPMLHHPEGDQKYGPVVLARIRLLRDAVNAMDVAYLTLHQYMAMDALGMPWVPHPSEDLNHIVQAFAFLNEPLVSNRQIDKRMLMFFANFPVPLPVLRQHSPEFCRNQLGHLALTCRAVSSRWTQCVDMCKQRGVPPIASEITYHIRVDSPILQGVIFYFVLRCICGPLPPSVMTEIEASFRINRQRSSILKGSTNHLSPQVLAQIESEDNACLQQLKVVLGRIRGITASGVNNQRLSSVPSVMTQQPPGGGPHPPVHRIPANHLPSHHRHPVPRQQLSPSHGAVGSIQSSWMNQFSGASSRLAVSTSPQSLMPGRVPTNSSSHVEGVPLNPLRNLLIPQPGVSVPQAARPDPGRLALHQLHLRSPILVPRSLDAAMEKLYQFVSGFVLEPRIPDLQVPVHIRRFTIRADDFRRIPKQTEAEGERSKREINESSISFRLRCVKATEEVMRNESAWSIADTSWPTFVYMQINGVRVEPRRKLHHGKDIPIDIAALVKQGENTFQIFANSKSENLRLKYAYAVETISVSSHSQIKRACTERQVIPDAEVKASIKAAQNLADDDDLQIVSSSINIALFDPITAYSIFDVPVRGRECKHRACFDLETFLQTRPSTQSDGPSKVDIWHCPLCKGDVRPKSMIIDGFLVEVRAELARQGLLDTRAITVDENGNWKSVCTPDQRQKPEEIPPKTPEKKRRKSTTGVLKVATPPVSKKSANTAAQGSPTAASRTTSSEIVILDD